MASTYSTNLGFELPGTGDQAGTWGITNNTNIGTLIEQAISGYATQAITDGADTVITIPNGASGVARNMTLELTGALTAARNLIVPANRKLYFIFNNTTGGYAVTVKVSGQTGVSVPNGQKMVLVCNGTDVVTAVTYAASMSVGNLSYTGTLTGGTGIVNLGSGQFYKDASGNVGIGTSGPSNKLDVVGANNEGIQYRTGTRSIGIGQISSQASVFWGSSTDLTFFSGSELARLTSNGNLGIGTANPGTFGRLAVLASTGTTSLYTGTGVQGLFVSTNESTRVVRYDSSGSLTGSHAWGNGPAEHMRLDSSGNLGIGTASPGTKLHVATAGNNYIASHNTAGSTSALLLGAESGQNTIYSWTTVAGSTGRPLAFYTGSSEVMRLDTSGNLGIGTASPAARLQVKSSLAQAVNIEGTSARGTGNIYAAFLDPTGRKGYFGYGSASDDGFYLFNEMNAFMVFGTNNTERMRLDSSGNLGIGTASPATRLDVSGAITLSATTSTPAGVFIHRVAADTMAFGVGGGERMRLDNSGNLGIGTASPAQRLHVVGGNYRQNDATNSYGFELQNGTGTSRLVTISGGSAFGIQTGGNAKDYLNLDGNGSVTVGDNNLTTTSTNGFLYVPTCAGTPTGTPTAKTGYAPVVVNTTNNKLYFYSGGAWRDAGP